MTIKYQITENGEGWDTPTDWSIYDAIHLIEQILQDITIMARNGEKSEQA